MLSILEEITEMTKNPSIKGFIQTRKENMHLRNENEKMKKQNRYLVQQNAAKDKEITLLNARLNQQQVPYTLIAGNEQRPGEIPRERNEG